jgi:hypothetical protein
MRTKTKLHDSLADARAATLTVFFTLQRQATANRRQARKLVHPLRALKSTQRDRDALPAQNHEDGCACHDCTACTCTDDGEFGRLVDACPVHAGATQPDATEQGGVS